MLSTKEALDQLLTLVTPLKGELVDIDKINGIELLNSIGLGGHITSQRTNGFISAVETLKNVCLILRLGYSLLREHCLIYSFVSLSPFVI